MTDYYTNALEREFDYREQAERQEIEREQQECCQQCTEIDRAMELEQCIKCGAKEDTQAGLCVRCYEFSAACQNCGKPGPIGVVLCDECHKVAQQELLDDEISVADQLGELPHGGWK